MLRAPPETAKAQDEGWVIRSFDVRYDLHADGSFNVREDIAVDFGALERHGIFRDMPVEYRYDSDNNRVVDVSDVSVTDGSGDVPFETGKPRPNIRIKIGDPDKLVSGPQRYVINYTLHDGLNPFADHDELFWNVTGNDWPVTVERASAMVFAPGPGVEQVRCFQGPTGSTAPCASSIDAASPSFRTTEAMEPGWGLTIVVGLRKRLIAVGPPNLAPANEDAFDKIQNSFEVNWWTVFLAAAAGILGLAALARLWWVAGRDRWFGNMYYIKEDPPEETKPLFARRRSSLSTSRRTCEGGGAYDRQRSGC